MRLDKYLKLSRIIKRRTIAKEVLDADLVTINGRKAKPSSEVNSGDILVLTLGERILTIRVLEILNSTKKKDALEMFEIIKDEVINSSL